MSNRGIIVLAQNSYERVSRQIPNHFLEEQYKGIHVDIWYPDLDYISGQHVWYDNKVFRFVNTCLQSKTFNYDDVKLVIPEVYIHYDKNDLVVHHLCKKNNIVLSDNNIYEVRKEDETQLYTLTPQFEGVNIDIWYKEVLHLAGQHVWHNNRVWRALVDVPANSEFTEDDYEPIIDQEVKLYADSNKSLVFENPRPGNLVCYYNNLYTVDPVLQVDYVKQAVLLALSLSKNSPNEKISIITNDIVPADYEILFDKIIPIPFGDDAETTIWKVENRWKIYHCSPYDETIVMDTDMMVFNDLTSTWNMLSDSDLFFTSEVRTFNNNVIENDFYRKTFTENYLPNTYVGVHYFKQSDLAKNFYNLLEIICKNWKEFWKEFLPNQTPGHLSIDVAAAIAIKILNIEEEVTNKKNNILTFTHLKPMIQGWNNPPDRWQDKLGVYLDDNCNLKLGNFVQNGILHYTEKDFVEKVFNKYKEITYV